MVETRKTCLSGQRCRPVTEAEAWHCQVEHDPTYTVEDLVGELAGRFDVHVRRSYLYEAANPHRSDHSNAQARLITPLTRISGRHVLLDFYETACSRVALPLPVAPTHSLEEAELASTVIRSFSEHMGRFMSILGGGEVSAQDLADIKRESTEVMRWISAQVQHAEQLYQHGRPGRPPHLQRVAHTQQGPAGE